MSAGPLGINIPITANIKEALGDLKGAKSEIMAEMKEVRAAIKEAKETGDEKAQEVGRARLGTLEAKRDALKDKLRIEKEAKEAVKNSVSDQFLRIQSKASQLVRGGITLGDAQAGMQAVAQRLVTSGRAGRFAGTKIGEGMAQAGVAISKGGAFLGKAAGFAGPVGIAVGTVLAEYKIINDHFMAMSRAAQAKQQTAEGLLQFTQSDVFGGGFSGSRLGQITNEMAKAGDRAREAYINASIVSFTKDALGFQTPEAEKAAQENMKNNLELQKKMLELGFRGAQVTPESIQKDPAFQRKFGTFRVFAADDELGIVDWLSTLIGNDARSKNLQIQSEKRQAAIVDGLIASRRAEEQLRKQDPIIAFQDQNTRFSLRAQERQDYELTMQWNPF